MDVISGDYSMPLGGSLYGPPPWYLRGADAIVAPYEADEQKVYMPVILLYANLARSPARVLRASGCFWNRILSPISGPSIVDLGKRRDVAGRR